MVYGGAEAASGGHNHGHPWVWPCVCIHIYTCMSVYMCVCIGEREEGKRWVIDSPEVRGGGGGATVEWVAASSISLSRLLLFPPSFLSLSFFCPKATN